ncbi:hypothetical protein H310_04188 [Aphanomyces invadans]|uniref:alpha-1,2-Mannosidase n=1 Tax=Aphanomyces invadans TaxID=157072 RepID=A0A024UG62_9STRA|nr:hypothetical protein H310_04188 [Aphanomyces invadans]ETW05195.1 hypothetical protein H310_04188 [Aphanomyces invadans]|eukprot:XP_008866633.1 hypothetical protein H310_04188 [Aphanomyces invadans]
MALSSRARVPLFVTCFALFVVAQVYIVTRLGVEPKWDLASSAGEVSTHRFRDHHVDETPVATQVDSTDAADSNILIAEHNPRPTDGVFKDDVSTMHSTAPFHHDDWMELHEADPPNTPTTQPTPRRKTSPSSAVRSVAFVPRPDVGIDGKHKQRMHAIRGAMQHAWTGYETHAFGADEVGPVSGSRKQDVWGDLGVTLVDALDTLYIFGMTDEFQRARDWVATGLDFTHLGKDGDKISVFEITIRELGGLLSAYDLSEDPVFKARAVELADLLLPAFADGVFYTQYNAYTQAKSMNGWTGYRGLLADIGTLQLELRRVSDITGNHTYAEKGDAFYEIVQREGSYENTGLFPVHFDVGAGKFATSNTVITIGALGDSFYEYLLKVWLYSGRRESDQYLRDLYNDAVRGIETNLLRYSEPDDAYYLQELMIPGMRGLPKQDHLLCFVPGMLALGTLSDEDPARVIQHLDLAKKLMKTCYTMYSRQPTGLAPDIVHFPGYTMSDSRYRLRPETVESLMYLYRVTKDPIYQDWGWEIFKAIETHAKSMFGYGTVFNVNHAASVRIDDKMESFFLAETLKYHYLLQSSPSFVPLDEFVFNTEAHPFLIQSR